MFRFSVVLCTFAIFLICSTSVSAKSLRKSHLEGQNDENVHRLLPPGGPGGLGGPGGPGGPLPLVPKLETMDATTTMPETVSQEKVGVYIEGPRGGSASTTVHVPDRTYVQVYYDMEATNIEDLETEDKSINVHVDVPKVDIPKVDIPDYQDYIPDYQDYIPNYAVNIHVPEEANLNYEGEVIDATGAATKDFIEQTRSAEGYDYYIHGYPDVAIELHLPSYYEGAENVEIVRDMDDLEMSPEDVETENKTVNVHIDTPDIVEDVKAPGIPGVPNGVPGVPGVPNVNVNAPGIPNVNVHIN